MRELTTSGSGQRRTALAGARSGQPDRRAHRLQRRLRPADRAAEPDLGHRVGAEDGIVAVSSNGRTRPSSSPSIACAGIGHRLGDVLRRHAVDPARVRLRHRRRDLASTPTCRPAPASRRRRRCSARPASRCSACAASRSTRPSRAAGTEGREPVRRRAGRADGPVGVDVLHGRARDVLRHPRDVDDADPVRPRGRRAHAAGDRREGPAPARRRRVRRAPEELREGGGRPRRTGPARRSPGRPGRRLATVADDVTAAGCGTW